MSSLVARAKPLALLLALSWTAVALADEEPFVPSNDAIDQELDERLATEYSDDHPPPPPAGGPVVVVEDRDHDDIRGRVRLRMMGAYWRAHLSDLELMHRRGASGGDTVAVDDLDDADIDDDDHRVGGTGGGHYTLELSFNRHVALRGGFNHAVFKHDILVGDAELPTGFTYGETSWLVGDELSTRFEVYNADLDLVLRPVNNRYVTLDLSLGARYVYLRTELTRNSAQDPQEVDTLEAGVPMVGVGLAVRPVRPLELFAQLRFGHLSYEVDEHWDWDDRHDEWDYVERKERDSTVLEVDLGISVTIADTLGFILGYRFDYLELEKLEGDREWRTEGTAHGLYAGLILQFSD